METILHFLANTGFGLVDYRHLLMIVVGCAFIYLGIAKHYEPLLLVPIGFGILMGNIPVFKGFGLGIYEPGSVLNYLYFGVRQSIYPPLIFLGIGAMTDFSTMLARPILMLLGADGPTAIFLTSKLAPELVGPIAIAAYSYMALVPVIQPPIMKLLTTKEERLIRMSDPCTVSKREKVLFPIIGFLLCCFLAPAALPLLGMLFFGNLLKECMVADRLAQTARTALIDIVTIVLGLTVGASTQADVF